MYDIADYQMWCLCSNCRIKLRIFYWYSKTPIYRAPIYRKPRFTAPQNVPPKSRNRSTTPVYEHMILGLLNSRIGFPASCMLTMLIRSRIHPIWELIRVTSTDWVQFMLDEKPCDPNYWNPDLPLIPIYRTFFRPPKLCGKSVFYSILKVSQTWLHINFLKVQHIQTAIISVQWS